MKLSDRTIPTGIRFKRSGNQSKITSRKLRRKSSSHKTKSLSNIFLINNM